MTYLCFFRNFQINLEVKKFQNFEDLDLVVRNCEGTLRGLRILPLNMAAQILVVFEIAIFKVFSKKFQNLDFKKFQNFEYIIPLVRNFEGCGFCLQI